MVFRVGGIALALSLLAGAMVLAAPAAVVNGVAIPCEEYLTELETFPMQGQHEQQPAGAAALHRLVSQYLMIQLAEKEGVPVTDEQLDRRIEETRKDGTLENTLKSRSITLDEYKREMRAEQSFVNVVTKGVQVTDGEIQDYFFKNRDRYRLPLRVKIAAIVVKDKEKIDLAHSRLEEGEDFASVVKELSEDDTTKDSGGIVGWVWPNQAGVPSIVSNTAFGLKVGDASRPIKVDDKWVIVKAEERRLPGSTSLEEVRERIWQTIAVERGMKYRNIESLLQQFRSAADIKINIERFKDLSQRLKEKP